MKNSIILLLLSVMTLPVMAQFTKGGSEKNYERYRTNMDSIVTIEKIPVNAVSKTAYSAFTLGFSSPLDDLSKEDPAFLDFWYGSLYSPYYSGNMGLKTGFNAAINGIAPFNSINKNLIRNIDLGLSYSYFFSTVGFDFKSIVADSNGFTQNFFNNEASYVPFLVFGIGLGPSVTIISNPKKPSVLVDLYARANITFVGGGTFSGRYTYPSGTYFELETEREDLSVIFSQTLGFTLRTDKIGLFLEANLGITNDKMETEYTGTFRTNSSQVNGSSETIYMNESVNLNHLKVGLSLPLGNK